MTRLYGIPDGRLRLPSSEVAYTQFRGMVGNNFKVTVVAKIVDRMLWTMNVTIKLMEGVEDCGAEAMPWQDLKLDMQRGMPSCTSSVKRKRRARGK